VEEALDERFGPDALRREKARKYKGFCPSEGCGGYPAWMQANWTAERNERFGTDAISVMLRVFGLQIGRIGVAKGASYAAAWSF